MSPITRRRLALGLSQSALAKKVGVATNTVYRWETGKISPGPSMFPRLAAAFDCSAAELVDEFYPPATVADSATDEAE